eukprot:14936740-Alexandrium_andersonii.AAC.1
MRIVRDTWRRLEACTCLRSNDAKTCTWQVRIVDGRPVTEGTPAKALGVFLPALSQQAVPKDAEKLATTTGQARRVGALPLLLGARRA